MSLEISGKCRVKLLIPRRVALFFSERIAKNAREQDQLKLIVNGLMHNLFDPIKTTLRCINRNNREIVELRI